jgi:hypothetical protein
MPNYVQFYKSTDQGMPPLSGQSNSLITLLNAILVDGPGFTGVSVTGVTRVGTTATATVSATNGLRLRTGMWITISGASDATYNGTFQITVASTTTFTYTMGGTPAASPAVGTILMAATMPVSTITKSGTTATVTLTNADSSLVTGHYVVIAGASDALYNGTFAITWVSPTSFTYTMTGTPAANASGTLVYSRAGLQWTRPFAAGANSQTYRSADASSNKFYLQIIDNAATAGGAKEAQIYGAEVMSADQTVTSGRFPTVAQFTNGLVIRKSTTADSTVREWTLWGDDRTFYLVTSTGDAGNTNNHSLGFGHFISNKSGDGFNTFVCGGVTFNNATTTQLMNIVYAITSAPSATGGMFAPRAYSQLGTSAALQLGHLVQSSPASLTSYMTYPNPPDNGFYCMQAMMQDSVNTFRGRFPGMYFGLHQTPFNHYDQITGVTGLSGITLTTVTVSSGSNVGQWYVDTFGPWN